MPRSRYMSMNSENGYHVPTTIGARTLHARLEQRKPISCSRPLYVYPMSPEENRYVWIPNSNHATLHMVLYYDGVPWCTYLIWELPMDLEASDWFLMTLRNLICLDCVEFHVRVYVRIPTAASTAASFGSIAIYSRDCVLTLLIFDDHDCQAYHYHDNLLSQSLSYLLMTLWFLQSTFLLDADMLSTLYDEGFCNGSTRQCKTETGAPMS